MAKIALRFLILAICLALPLTTPANANGFEGYIPTLHPNLIIKIQETLNEQGYDLGKADANWGPKSQRALDRFIHDKHVKVIEPDHLSVSMVKALWNIDLKPGEFDAEEVSEDQQEELIKKLGLTVQ